MAPLMVSFTNHHSGTWMPQRGPSTPSFEVPGPDGRTFTINSSQASGKPI